MKRLFLTLAVASLLMQCGAIEKAGDSIADSIEGVGDGIESQIDGIEDKIDSILEEHGVIGSSDDAADDDDTLAIEDETGTEFVASYTLAADTCDDRYEWPSATKFFAEVEDGEITGSKAVLTDIAGSWETEGDIDTDTDVVLFDIEGSSALDVINCACEFDADGFTCHCDGDDESCAVVYIIKE